MKKETKSITRKNKGAVKPIDASTLPRFTLPPPLSIQKLDGEISALVTCEIKREAFSGEIIVNVIEKIGGQYAKRIISWRDVASNFYFSKWRDWPAIQEEHCFYCRNIRTGVPMDPYYYRKHPLAIKELESNQHFKEILGASSPELTSLVLLPVEVAVMNNLMAQSIHKREILSMDWADIRNDYCCVVREVIAPTDDEISKFEYLCKHGNEIPSMYWYEMDEKPFPQCFQVPIAEQWDGKEDAQKDIASKQPTIGKRIEFGDGCQMWFESLGEKRKPAIIRINNPATKEKEKPFRICNGPALENIKRLFVSKAISEDKAIYMKNPWRGLISGPYKHFVKEYIKRSNEGRKWYINPFKPK